jgi:hypothetical protein
MSGVTLVSFIQTDATALAAATNRYHVSKIVLCNVLGIDSQHPLTLAWHMVAGCLEA